MNHQHKYIPKWSERQKRSGPNASRIQCMIGEIADLRARIAELEAVNANLRAGIDNAIELQNMAQSDAEKAERALAEIEKKYAGACGLLWPDTAIAAQPVPQDLLTAGAMMANTMFNLAQQPGKTLTWRECGLFADMRKKWDEASSRPTAPGAAVRAAPP